MRSRCALLLFTCVLLLPAAEPDAQRAAAQKLGQDGNWAEAYQVYADILAGDGAIGQDLHQAVQCLNRLGRQHEFDALVEGVVETHGGDWRMLQAAARAYRDTQHWGFIVSGAFERGHHRGGGKQASALDRDRVRALQLLRQAVPLLPADAQTAGERASFWIEHAELLRYQRPAWRFQALTDLAVLPDYEETPYWGWSPHSEQGAPVDAEGEPVLHGVPESWELAATDGERWRWCLMRAAEADPNRLGETLRLRADFTLSQFGVQTMGGHGIVIPMGNDPDADADELGPWAVHTLKEDEILARLANGVRRLTLPAEHHPIALYRRLVELDQGWRNHALNQLGQIHLNRRQYPRSAGWYEQAGNQRMVDQIRGAWGSFEPTTTRPAGEPATLVYTFRNGEGVDFTAHKLKVRTLLDDVRRYLGDREGQVDWQLARVDNLGFRLIEANQQRYRGEVAAQWHLDLTPARDHFDKKVTVETPLEEAGAYLITAKLAGGTTSTMVIWIADTALVTKPVEGAHWYYVADAVTGEPIAGATVDCFGFDVHHERKRRWVTSKRIERATGPGGQVRFTDAELDRSYRWLITATTEDGRLAYHGFEGVWLPNRHHSTYHQQKGYVITDRPVYRPGDTVHISAWLRQARYDLDAQEGAIKAAAVTLQIHDAKGEKLFEQQLRTDPYGGVQAELELPADAALGSYGVQINGYNASRSFRVEEYKKPEFEVVVEAPSEPVALGERFEATIEARYLFGAPVTEGEVHYTVTRSEKHGRWYPPGPWDWLYGPGYWWFSDSYAWYPGWRSWGCIAPRPWWMPWHQPPPEVVAEATVPLDADGIIEVEIDTGLAKAVMGDRDHEYTISAEVVDQSRRTIVGAGSVIAAREPFDVTVWIQRGWMRVGDPIEVHAAAVTIDGNPVAATGTATLLRIGYDDERMPQETAVATVEVETDAEGRVHHRFEAQRAGQYRVKVALTDPKGRTIEGGYVLAVLGGADEQIAPGDFRFNALELIPDQREYAPGESVRIMIAADRAGATVLLFIRPEGGVYPAPQVLKLDGRSRVIDLPITRGDMPNIYLEAVTVSGGEVHTVTEEIVVPPADRMLQVTLTPAEDEVLPGAEVAIDISVTDETGAPVVGPTALTVYDKAIEYIAGGSNMDDIRKFFWEWRRHHNPRTVDNLSRWFGEVFRRGQDRMQTLGVFGHLTAEFADDMDAGAKELEGGARRMRSGGAVAADAMVMEEAAMAPAPAGMAMAKASAEPSAQATNAAGGAAQVQPTIRSQFADSAFWDGRIITDEQGKARVTVTMPEDLTTWMVRAWSLGHGTRVGQAQSQVITTKNFVIRLQAPRFFVERDEVVLSANVHNYLDAAKSAEVKLELSEHLAPMAGVELSRTLDIPAGGEVRVDWRVKVVDEGEAVIRMFGLTDEESDAVERRFPVKVYGAPRVESRSIAIRGEATEGEMRFAVPEQRIPGASELVVQVSPSLAASMIEALPYLASYPYGCTEQTLNRFVPTVICLDLLRGMDVDLAAVAKAEALDAGALPDGGHEDWRQWEHNPVFHQDEVEDMVRQGVQRLRDMQVSDGGWGWFSGWGEQSYPHTTAVVVHGLRQAKQAGATVPDGLIQQGHTWLTAHLQERVRWIAEKPDKRSAHNLDALVFTVLCEGGTVNREMQAYLYRDRGGLSLYAKAMMAFACHHIDAHEQRDMYRRNVEQFLVEDAENQTAYLDMDGAGGYWWYWYGSESEAHAWYLKLLAAVEPKADRTAAVAKYLLTNRRHATYWDSTRDTALCIEALAEFLVASGERAFSGELEILLDGEVVKTVAVTPETLFTTDGRYVLAGEAIATGDRVVTVRRKGEGACYANAWLSLFDQQDTIPAAGLEVKVTRQVYRLERVEAQVDNAGDRGQVLKQDVVKYRRIELQDGDAVRSGDLLEVELSIAAKNDYEYILFEDYKPAGVEPVDVRSGYYADGLHAYRELRDDRVALFIRQLARGEHSIAYRVRAEVPGTFTALPTQASAMYAPELRGNSASRKLVIEDRP